MRNADGSSNDVARLDESVAEKVAAGDEFIGPHFRAYEELVIDLVGDEDYRGWALEGILQQREFARREWRRFLTTVELDVDPVSVGAQLTRNLFNVMRVNYSLRRLARVGDRSMQRYSQGSEVLGAIHRDARRMERTQSRRTIFRVLRAIVGFNALRIVIFGVVTAATTKLISGAFSSSLGWWGLVFGSATGYTVVHYLAIPWLTRRFDALIRETLVEIVTQMSNACLANSARYIRVAQTQAALGHISEPPPKRRRSD